MRKIILACMAGLSTSMLVTKMKEAAKKDDYDCEITAYPISSAKDESGDADVVLLGPQLRLQLDSIKKDISCPVEVIDMSDYGMMNGEKVMQRVKEILND